MLSVFDGLRDVTTLSVFVRLACALICGPQTSTRLTSTGGGEDGLKAGVFVSTVFRKGPLR